MITYCSGTTRTDSRFLTTSLSSAGRGDCGSILVQVRSSGPRFITVPQALSIRRCCRLGRPGFTSPFSSGRCYWCLTCTVDCCEQPKGRGQSKEGSQTRHVQLLTRGAATLSWRQNRALRSRGDPLPRLESCLVQEALVVVEPTTADLQSAGRNEDFPRKRSRAADEKPLPTETRRDARTSGEPQAPCRLRGVRT